MTETMAFSLYLPLLFLSVLFSAYIEYLTEKYMLKRELIVFKRKDTYKRYSVKNVFHASITGFYRRKE